MSDNYKKYEFRLCGEGMNREALPWPKYKELMDALVRALSGMKNGPKHDDILPGEVKDGSAAMEYYMEEKYNPIVKKIADGPNDDWDIEEKMSIEDLHRVVAKQKAQAFMKTSDGHEHRINLIIFPAKKTKVGYESITGIVLLTGGQRKAKVHLRTRIKGKNESIPCDADMQTTEKLGALLYHKVQVGARVVRYIDSGHIDKITILNPVDIKDLGHKDEWEPNRVTKRQAETIRSIRSIIAERMPDFNVDDYLSGLRDE